MTVIKKHDIVDFFDSRRISCGLVLEIIDDRKVRLLTDQGKETRISSNRALIVGQDSGFPFSGPRDDQINRLKNICREREKIKTEIDLKELWEVVGGEAEEIAVEDLSELCFGAQADADHSASLVRAIFEDRVFFRLRANVIEIPSDDAVKQALLQKEKELERSRFLQKAAEFLERVKNGSPPHAEDAPAGLIPLLEEAAVLGREWVNFKQIRELFNIAGMGNQWDPFRVLVSIGLWSEHENITLRAEGLSIEFSANAERAAEEIAAIPQVYNAPVLDGELITIDSVFTRDIDDALSLEHEGDERIMGVHITDVAHFLPHDSLLDREIRERAVSVYLPDLTIPMIPRLLSEQAASLRVGELRPVISLFVRFGRDLSIKGWNVRESVARVSRRLSYDEADELIARPESSEAEMYALACKLREMRSAAGAVIFRDPELFVHVLEDGIIEVSARDRETPSQVLVSEMMILANHLFARFLRERGAPAIFRSQPPPLEPIQLGEEYDPVVSYRSKKLLSRGDLSAEPAPHSTLGLDVYATGTSPIRRYVDLLIQRQLKSMLRNGAPALSRAQLEDILSQISYRLERAGALERERQRYFLLRWLETRRQEELECVTLHRFPKFYLVQIRSLGFNAALHVPGGVTLIPGDRVMARIEKIQPREEKLTLSLVKQLTQ